MTVTRLARMFPMGLIRLAPRFEQRRAAVCGVRGWAGALRRALGGADTSQAREALRQMGGRITLRLHTERGERRALRPDQTLDGKGIEAGTWQDR